MLLQAKTVAMAEKQATKPIQATKYKFKNVQLFKSETLGTGSYGAVCKAKCDQLPCAAKIFNPFLFQLQASNSSRSQLHQEEHFEQDCLFLSLISHPNIIQYLGTYHDPETNSPVLLMELMDESLTHFLESSPGDIPYHIQVNLSCDIAQALAFLHANGIIHRDLSSNNVLLLRGCAKVADFEIMKYLDLNKARRASCLETPVFMPPEILNEPPVYTEKMDNFSLGVIMVQIITRNFPNPTEQFEMIDVQDPRSSLGTRIRAQVPVSEIKRREAHISKIDTTHPLLPIALDCLKDQEVDRPTSKQLCQSLDALKETSLYKECSKPQGNQSVNTGTQEVAMLKHQIHERDELLQTKDKELQAMIEALEAKEELIGKKDTQNLHLSARLGELYVENKALKEKIKSRHRPVVHVKESKPSRKEQAAPKDNQYDYVEYPSTVSLQGPFLTRTTNKQQQESERRKSDPPAPYLHPVPSKRNLSLSCKPLPSSPYCLYAGSSAMLRNRAYFKSRRGDAVIKYEVQSRKWYKLLQHPLTEFTIVCTARYLTSVGGRSAGEHSNKLYSFIDGEWKEYYPAMPTKRVSPAAVYVAPYLIAAGGSSDVLLSIVEVLNTASNRWSAVCSLPFPTDQPSVAVHGGYIYIAAGERAAKEEECTVLRSTLSSLISPKPGTVAWDRTANLPFSQSTLATVRGHLLAIGGCAPQRVATKDVYAINQTNGYLWDLVGQLSSCRCNALTAVLSENRVIVVGSSVAEESMSAEVVTVFAQ